MNKQTGNKTSKQKNPGSKTVEYQSSLRSGVTPPASSSGVGI
jgi:hypothetical protein